MVIKYKPSNDTIYREGFRAGFLGLRYWNIYVGADKLDFNKGWTKGARQRAIKQFSFLPITTTKHGFKDLNKGVKKKISVNIK